MPAHRPGYLLSLLSSGLAGQFRLACPIDAWDAQHLTHIARTPGRPKISGLPEGKG